MNGFYYVKPNKWANLLGGIFLKKASVDNFLAFTYLYYNKSKKYSDYRKYLELEQKLRLIKFNSIKR
jgi:hypothetical protein